MSNLAIALKGLLERSYKGDTYLMNIIPHFGIEEWRLRLSYLSTAEEEGIIEEVAVSKDYIAFWALTAKGLKLEERLRGL